MQTTVRFYLFIYNFYFIIFPHCCPLFKSSIVQYVFVCVYKKQQMMGGQFNLSFDLWKTDRYIGVEAGAEVTHARISSRNPELIDTDIRC